MIHKDQYKLKNTHQYCIYIQENLYLFLKRNSQNNLSNLLEYLIRKYKYNVLNQKSISSLGRGSVQYQPKTKNYKRIILKNINPYLWKELKIIKNTTGYSISYIIRVMIEWEMQSKGHYITPLLPLEPVLSNNTQQQLSQNNFIAINNYQWKEVWSRHNNEISVICIDFL